MIAAPKPMPVMKARRRRNQSVMASDLVMVVTYRVVVGLLTYSYLVGGHIRPCDFYAPFCKDIVRCG